jgi:hypothetical protein
MYAKRFLLILLIPFFLLSFPNLTEAQRAGIGITAGLNTSSHLQNFRFVSGDIDLDFTPGFTTGFNAGLIYRHGLTQRFRLQAEPTITMLGASYNDSFVLRGFDFETDSKTQLLYLQLPLLLQLSTTPPERTVFGREPAETTYHLSGGIFGGYLLDAQFSGTNSGAPIGIAFEGDFSEDVKPQYKEYDGGVIFGGGVEYGSTNKVGAELRFFFSVFDSGNQPDISFKPQNLGVTLNLYFIM